MSKNKPEIYGHLAILKLSQIVTYDCTLNNAAKRIFTILAGYAGNEDYSCFPSASKIAKALGISRQAVTKQIDILNEHQYLIKKRRTNEKTKARKSNILIFQVDIAKQYYGHPEIFCQKNVTLVVAYLVTLLRYGVMQPNDVMCPATSKDCTKKTPKKTNLRKHYKTVLSKEQK